ncbi:MAG: membrane protein insertion efficiency factor YidD [Candidatus Zixiibacteriota bacterium]
MIERAMTMSRRIARGVGMSVSMLIIHSYRVILAPFLVGGCRHWPTCSHYAEESLRKHGLRQGWRMALGRIFRCRPGGTYGFDPVPDAAPTTPKPMTGRAL